MVLDSPIHVHWELTRDCNLNCIHCYQQDDKDNFDLSEEQATEIALELIRSKVFQVTLTGGEPFGRPYLQNLIEIFNKENIKPHITTNGTLLNNSSFDWIENVDISIQISLDSHLAEKHNKIRKNPQAFNLAMQGINFLKNFNKHVSIAFCANKFNFTDIEGVIQLSILNKIDSVVIGEVLPFFGDKATRKGLSFSKVEYQKFIEYCVDLREKYKNQIGVFINTEWGFLFSNQIEHAPCSALDRDLAILFDGSISPCPFIRNSKNYIGNILNEDLRTIWKSNKAMAFRNDKHKGCDSNCEHFYKCMSGCKAELANLGQDIKNQDLNCYHINYKFKLK